MRRPTKLAAATLGMAASLTLTFAATSAALGGAHLHMGGHQHGCRLTLAFKETVITKGDAAVAAGQLSCAGEGKVPSQTVTLFERPAGSSTYTEAASGATEGETGAYSIEVKNLEHNAVFYAIADGARSAHRQEKVFAEVTLEGPPEGTVFTGRHNQVKFTGTVSPEDENAIVVLQRQNAIRGEEWHRIGQSVRVQRGGTFEITHTFGVPGPANIRVVVRSPAPHSLALNAPSPSNIRTYEIVQQQRPELLIESSADPISFGQQISIKGTAQNVAKGTAVRLLARSAHQRAFAPVAQTEVKEAGAYEFEGVTPLVGTLYKVQTVGKTSAVLFEGVKYVLTAAVTPSPGTIPQGEELTFSGTVKPGTGFVREHPVYLEREDASHVGFHVIAKGDVLPPTSTEPEYTFKITYALFKVGTSVLRIRIPGDPQNGSTISEKFTFQVNRAPASTLVSEPSESPTLPSEGQL
jgi:hypothetical protein